MKSNKKCFKACTNNIYNISILASYTLGICLIFILILFSIISSYSVYRENDVMGTVDDKKSVISLEEVPSIEQDRNLKIEQVVSDLKFPTSMAFLGEEEILVLELNGTVLHVIKNMLQPEPLIDLNVSRIIGERGLLGIAVSTVTPGHTYVYLYYTESQTDNGEPLAGYIDTNI
jgi:glucose/arabinose dehydrogenase